MISVEALTVLDKKSKHCNSFTGAYENLDSLIVWLIHGCVKKQKCSLQSYM